MKYFKRMFLLNIFVMATAIIFIVVFNKFINSYSEEKQMYEKYINTQIITSKDTVTVIDYSLMKETFTLSNGLEVNKKIVMKEKIYNGQ
jgi:hypothetical protein